MVAKESFMENYCMFTKARVISIRLTVCEV